MSQAYIDIAEHQIDCISPEQAWRYRILPIEWTKEKAVFYNDAHDKNLIDELEILFGKSIEIIALPTQTLNKTLGKYYRKTNSTAESLASISSGTNNIIQKIIAEAQALGSSDIHIEYYENKARVRYRIDGKLIHRFSLETASYKAITNQIKLKAGANLAEVRLPQDGRLDLRELGLDVDIRASILPVHGKHEKVVLRILGSEAAQVDFEQLGFREEQLKAYLKGISRPSGIILISGPTGSGKTTTLYSTLMRLNTESVNITTIENPIEYVMEGINQVQLHDQIGLDFAYALKTFLRQDPDIIMVGEIRDPETAEMAVRASLTGHLVFSTIHTNSAWGTISRLIDMQVPLYLLADTLNTSVAQRLVRLLCNNCKLQSSQGTERIPEHLKNRIHSENWHEPQGCETCYYTGYKGRIAIYEVIGMDNGLRQLIKDNQSDQYIKKELKKRGYTSLIDNALELLNDGKTSLEEIYPIILTF